MRKNPINHYYHSVILHYAKRHIIEHIANSGRPILTNYKFKNCRERKKRVWIYHSIQVTSEIRINCLINHGLFTRLLSEWIHAASKKTKKQKDTLITERKRQKAERKKQHQKYPQHETWKKLHARLLDHVGPYELHASEMDSASAVSSLFKGCRLCRRWSPSLVRVSCSTDWISPTVVFAASVSIQAYSP